MELGSATTISCTTWPRPIEIVDTNGGIRLGSVTRSLPGTNFAQHLRELGRSITTLSEFLEECISYYHPDFLAEDVFGVTADVQHVWGPATQDGLEIVIKIPLGFSRSLDLELEPGALTLWGSAGYHIRTNIWNGVEEEYCEGKSRSEHEAQFADYIGKLLKGTIEVREDIEPESWWWGQLSWKVQLYPPRLEAIDEEEGEQEGGA